MKPDYKYLKEWYSSHTFHNSQFSDINNLIDLKRKKKRLISVCIPTLNEEKTIGKIVSTIREDLTEKYSLVDEIVIIDSGSEDRTIHLAKKMGADVYLASDYLKKYGSFRGKGNNLWLSLYLLKGDIIIWVDGDIQNMHPKFIYGIAGMLLEFDNISFVKGFYERPFFFNNKLIKKGGGRVTNILVKPIISTFLPELNVIRQPLSGEYGGRRALLEQLQFPTGFGVEISLLLDIYWKFGLDVIAQVDLDERIHRTPTMDRHPKMAFEVLGTLLRKLEQLKQVSFNRDLSSQLITINGKGKEFILDKFELTFAERPPIYTILEYINRRSHLQQ